MNNTMDVRLPVLNFSQDNSLPLPDQVSAMKRAVHCAEKYLITTKDALKIIKTAIEKESALLDLSEKMLNQEKMRREGSLLPSCPEVKEAIDTSLKPMENVVACLKISLMRKQNELPQAEKNINFAEAAVKELKKILQYLLQTYNGE